MAISIQSYFDHYSLEKDKLSSYGFHDGVYSTMILNNTIKITITITENDILLDAFDIQLNEPSISYSTSSFIKEEWEKIIENIKKKCGLFHLYINDQTNRIHEFMVKEFHTYPEFLFSDYPSFGVYRNQENKKWIAMIMNIDYSKLDKSKKGNIEIINIKAENVEQLWDKRNIYPAYHMNKKYWISILLDSHLDDETIKKLIRTSNQLIQ